MYKPAFLGQHYFKLISSYREYNAYNLSGTPHSFYIHVYMYMYQNASGSVVSECTYIVHVQYTPDSRYKDAVDSAQFDVDLETEVGEGLS